MKTDLPKLIVHIWNSLKSAAENQGHPWRIPALATVSPDGRPAVRSVVLRRALVETFTLVAHTDVRSPKVVDLRVSPATEWLFYDHESQVQIRLQGESRIITSGTEYEEAWVSTPGVLRPNYNSADPPGSPMGGRKRSSDQSDGKGNFALIASEIFRMDWLQLMPPEHERYLFTRTGMSWEGIGIVP